MSNKFGPLVAGRTQKSETAKSNTSGLPQVQNTEIMPKLGRPRAKRSDPAYTQVTAYIRKDTYIATKKLLLDVDGEFSELLEELVSEWVHKHQGKPAQEAAAPSKPKKSRAS
jgi:hypothetical protein